MTAVLKAAEHLLRRFESCPCRQQLRVSINAKLATLRCKFNIKELTGYENKVSSGGKRHNNSLAFLLSALEKGSLSLFSKASSRVAWGCTFACYSPYFFQSPSSRKLVGFMVRSRPSHGCRTLKVLSSRTCSCAPPFLRNNQPTGHCMFVCSSLNPRGACFSPHLRVGSSIRR